MKKAIHISIPAKRALKKIGRDLKSARIRRSLPMALLSERAGINRATLRKIEEGESTVSIGALVAVLSSLGMLDRLQDIADVKHDMVGLQLQDEQLPQRVHLPKRAS